MNHILKVTNSFSSSWMMYITEPQSRAFPESIPALLPEIFGLVLNCCHLKQRGAPVWPDSLGNCSYDLRIVLAPQSLYQGKIQLVAQSLRNHRVSVLQVSGQNIRRGEVFVRGMWFVFWTQSLLSRSLRRPSHGTLSELKAGTALIKKINIWCIAWAWKHSSFLSHTHHDCFWINPLVSEHGINGLNRTNH